MTLEHYLSSLSSIYKLGIAQELYDSRIPTLTQEIINKIANNTSLAFLLTKYPEGNVCMINNTEIRPEFRQNFVPNDILDYAYAVLHSSSFRFTNKKILKRNFPYPENTETFWDLAELGSQIKQIHSLETLRKENFITEFNIEEDNIINSPHFKNTSHLNSIQKVNFGRVYINKNQYFDNIPELVWNFQIEDHQPAQKWLNDKEGQNLTLGDINYYQKIIVALTETERIMNKIKLKQLGD
jgi:predicted helicase